MGSTYPYTLQRIGLCRVVEGFVIINESDISSTVHMNGIPVSQYQL